MKVFKYLYKYTYDTNIEIFKTRYLSPQLNYKIANQNGGISTTFERSSEVRLASVKG